MREAAAKAKTADILKAHEECLAAIKKVLEEHNIPWESLNLGSPFASHQHHSPSPAAAAPLSPQHPPQPAPRHFPLSMHDPSKPKPSAHPHQTTQQRHQGRPTGTSDLSLWIYDFCPPIFLRILSQICLVSCAFQVQLEFKACK
jgi:hypothetical protein